MQPNLEYNAFIQTCPLSWWRAYMQQAYTTYALLLGRSLEKDDKRRLWKRLKQNHIGITGITSSKTLAMMEVVMGNASESRMQVDRVLGKHNGR